MAAGGSAGHSGTYASDVVEVRIGDDGDCRTWDVTVKKAAEAIQQTKAAKEDSKEKMRKETAASNAARILDIIRNSSEPLTAPKLKTKTGMNTVTFAPQLNCSKARLLRRKRRVETVELAPSTVSETE